MRIPRAEGLQKLCAWREIGQSILRNEERLLFEKHLPIQGELRDQGFLISPARRPVR